MDTPEREVTGGRGSHGVSTHSATHVTTGTGLSVTLGEGLWDVPGLQVGLTEGVGVPEDDPLSLGDPVREGEGDPVALVEGVGVTEGDGDGDAHCTVTRSCSRGMKPSATDGLSNRGTVSTSTMGDDTRVVSPVADTQEVPPMGHPHGRNLA